MGNERQLLDRALGAALKILAIAWMISYAWRLISPLLPVLVGVAFVVGGIFAVLARYRERW